MSKEEVPNCDTCKKKEDYRVHGSDCPFNGYDYTQWQRECAVMRSGCMYHQDARKYLNKEAIEELEMLKEDAHNKGLLDTTGRSIAWNWTCGAYDRAIAMMKRKGEVMTSPKFYPDIEKFPDEILCPLCINFETCQESDSWCKTISAMQSDMEDDA